MKGKYQNIAHMIFISLCVLFYTLISFLIMFDSPPSPRHFSTVSFRDHLVNSMVLVTAATRTTDRIKKNLRTLFPSDLSLIPISDTRIDQYINTNLTRQKTASAPDSNNESKENDFNHSKIDMKLDTVDKNIEVRKKILKISNGLSVEGGSGVSVVVLQALIDQVSEQHQH